jgi:uncharacterized protein (UPF0333 family)
MNTSVIPPSFRVLYIFVFLFAVICASIAVTFIFEGCSGVRYFSHAKQNVRSLAHQAHKHNNFYDNVSITTKTNNNQ